MQPYNIISHKKEESTGAKIVYFGAVIAIIAYIFLMIMTQAESDRIKSQQKDTDAQNKVIHQLNRQAIGEGSR